MERQDKGHKTNLVGLQGQQFFDDACVPQGREETGEHILRRHAPVCLNYSTACGCY